MNNLHEAHLQELLNQHKNIINYRLDRLGEHKIVNTFNTYVINLENQLYHYKANFEETQVELKETQVELKETQVELKDAEEKGWHNGFETKHAKANYKKVRIDEHKKESYKQTLNEPTNKRLLETKEFSDRRHKVCKSMQKHPENFEKHKKHAQALKPTTINRTTMKHSV
tara:strand:- start:9270 stop:9779 length:510 start_codon:yes stop_codon:yes gene_type:complete